MHYSICKFFLILILCFNGTKIGKCFSLPSSDPRNLFKKSSKVLAIETTFKLPSPIPTWPPGGGFASGTIDLGGLQVSQVSSFNKIWATHEGGQDNLGATFFEPSQIPEGFFMLGSYSQPNNMPLFGYVLVGKDATGSTLKLPIDYTLVGSSENLNIKQDGNGYIWLPTCPDGYMAVGYVVTSSSGKPPLEKIRCVRSDFTDSVETDVWSWGQGNQMNVNGFNVYNSRPTNRSVQAMSVSTGSFVAQNGGGTLSLACLKNAAKDNLGNMPNLSQIEALIQAYSPFVYFHPDEQYLPSSVDWFFQNGALLYQKGQESNPTPIKPTGSNLPQGGSNDDSYWLALPIDGASRERVKKGDLQDAGAYFHVKPALGGTFTDIAIWVFYPFNGASRAKVEFININLGKIGEHVGDWEHVTLRVSNLNGGLNSVFFSQHSGGTWVSASLLEYQNGNKPVVYSSLHGHATFPKAGLVLEGGSGGIGLRDDTAKSKMVMDTGVRSVVVAAEYLGSVVVEPQWLNYERKWGPKIDYDLDKEINNVKKFLPWKLKGAFGKFIRSIPYGVLGEEGPTGPKAKNSWSGDEMN